MTASRNRECRAAVPWPDHAASCVRTPSGVGDAHKDKGADNDSISVQVGDGTADRDLVENLRKNPTSAPSRDGLGAQLFPLTSKAQAADEFHLLGRERMNGRETYHLAFAPTDKSDFGWKGRRVDRRGEL